VKHNGIQQGWIIFDSATAWVSQPTTAKQVLKEMAVVKKTILHLCAKNFCGKSEAKATLVLEIKKLKLLRLVDQRVTTIS